MNSKIIAKRLTDLRGNNTQKYVADKIGLAQSTYAMYESGKRIPSDNNKIKIANLYGKTVQSIFFDFDVHK